MEYNGEIAKLIINDAYYEDTGDYSCEIWNEHGHQSHQFKIIGRKKHYVIHLKHKGFYFRYTLIS